MSTLITNIGGIVTGRVDAPIRSEESIAIENGTIHEIGATTTDAETVIDANGLTVTPGLIDAHTHPTIGGYTPRQNTLGWPESYIHCGVTSMVSAGEPHVPGCPREPTGLRALATLTRTAYDNHRPGGAKIHAGTLLLTDEMTEADVEAAHRDGIERMKILFSFDEWDRARDLVRWGRERDMVTIMHTGTSSFQESPIEFDLVRHVQPDIAAHLTGGPIPMPDEEVYRTVEETDAALEFVVGGNQRLALEVVERAIERDELDRIHLGTDTPAGTGIVSRGMFIQIALLAGLTDVPASEVLCMATGNAARHHDLAEGIVDVGRPADICLLGASVGSESDDALSAMDRGELPAVDTVIVDGTVEVETSRNMPPAQRPSVVQ